jgi:carotenoid 1,2-hydratase
VIGFIGSVFSPWYAWSGRRNPANHVCINVATYGPGGRFAMTDRGTAALKQTADSLTVGPSSMHWNRGVLEIEINEVSAPPLVSRLRGRITVIPSALTSVEAALTPDGSHVWRPFAPSCDIRVDLQASGWQWDGHGYFDANFGTRALEQDFHRWTWGRFPLQDGSACFYDATLADGRNLSLSARFDIDGQAHALQAPPPARLPRSLWAVARETRSDPGFIPHQVQPMLDSPFYCRSAIRTRINGEDSTGVHEALDLQRFRSRLMKPMLACRVPRRSNWNF